MPAVELLYDALMHRELKALAVLNAQPHHLLLDVCQKASSYELLQTFKPWCDDIAQLGLHSQANVSGCFSTVAVFPSKNKCLTLSHMAAAMLLLPEGGEIIMACANSHGAKSYDAALKKIAGSVTSSSKSKCRIFSARRSSEMDVDLAEQWIRDAQMQRVEAHGLWSQPGLFSWDRADIGSQLLLQHLPELCGMGMDLCCGYGLLSAHIMKKNVAVEHIDMVEADASALLCAEKNLMPWQDKVACHWQNGAADGLPKRLDWAVCNPPFHTGQIQDIELGQAIVAQGCRSLKRGGHFYMVANRKLPYEHILEKHLRHYQVIAEEQGFKIIRGDR